MNLPPTDDDLAPGGEWTPGQVILSEYEVVSTLGRGGMASVYLVRHVDRSTLLAAKRPHPHFAQSQEFRAAFGREAQIWIALPEHPHIARCQFVREEAGLPVLLAEYVSEGSLADWRRQRRFRDLPHVIDLTVQIAEAMRLAERLELVHRDLKPSNCLMDRMGRVKVTDFGLLAAAHHVVATLSEEQAPLPFAGTQEYCSPEQFDGQAADSAADMWSLGVLLFEMMTGRRPNFGPAAPTLIQEHRRTYGLGATPQAMWDLLDELTAPRVDDRPASFADVSERLTKIYADVAGKSYERSFPRPYADLQPPTSDEGLRDRAVRLLEVVCREVGQESVNAERFVLTLPGGRRGGASDMLGTIAICREAQRQLRRGGGSPRRRRLAGAAVAELLANAYRKVGNLRGAVDAYGAALAELERLHAEANFDHDRDALRAAMARCLHDRAVSHRQSGNLDAASADYDRALKLLDRSQQKSPASPAAARDDDDNVQAAMYQARAMLLLQQGQLADALGQIEAAVELRQRLVRSAGGQRYVLDLAGTLLNRGVIRRNSGDLPRAVDDYCTCLDLAARPDARGEMVGRDEIVPQALLNRATVYLRLGNVAAAEGDCDRAVEDLGQFWESSREARHLVALSQAYNNRANCRRLRADAAGALEDIDRCIELRQRLVDEDGREELAGELARALANKALFLLDVGEFARAWPVCERAVRWLGGLVRRTGRTDLQADLGKLMCLTGQVYWGIGQQQQALAQFAQAVEVYAGVLSVARGDAIEGWLEALGQWLRSGRAANEWFKTCEQATESVARTLGRQSLRLTPDHLRQVNDLCRFVESTSGNAPQTQHLSGALQRLESTATVDRP